MNEITFELEKKSEIPLYLQLYTYLKKEIKSNRIQKGTKLPSIRNMSKSLGVSKITVDNAYQQLLEEGYIESRHRSGMYVLEVEESLVSNNKTKEVFVKETEKNRDIKYDFSYSQVDTEGFNFNIWRKFTSQVLQRKNSDILDYGDRQGEIGLREEIADYLRTSRGVICSADQVIITAGTQNSIELFCRLTELEDKTIAVEEPGWRYARFMFQYNGFKVIPIPLDKNGISLDILKKNPAKLVYVTPSHQFPSGVVMPITRRQNLLKWAEKTGGYIIEDDYDSEFRYSGRPIPAMHGLAAERVIYLGTFSKSLAPSLRMSYLICPKKFLEKYKGNIYMYEQPVPRINQLTLELFMSNGYWDRHIRKMRRIYQKKQTLLVKMLNLYLGKDVKIIDAKAGLHVLIEIQNGMNEAEIVKKTEEAGVRIYPTQSSWSNPLNQNYPRFLIGFGGLNEEKITEGVKVLGTIL